MSQSNHTLNCIALALAFMSEETRAGNVPYLEAVALAAGLSEYHFSRVYKLATGEAPEETLARFKLAQTAEKLQNLDTAVAKVALNVSHTSTISISKAIRRVLSLTSAVTKSDEDSLSDASETIVIPRSSNGVARSDLAIDVAQIEPFETISKRTDGTYPKLNVAYEALFAATGGPEQVQAILGRPFGDISSEARDELRFECSLKVSDRSEQLPSDIIASKVSGGMYLRTRHLGSYDHLSDAIDRLYLAALSHEGIQMADAPLLIHYIDDPESVAEGELRTDVYLELSV